MNEDIVVSYLLSEAILDNFCTGLLDCLLIPGNHVSYVLRGISNLSDSFILFVSDETRVLKVQEY